MTTPLQQAMLIKIAESEYSPVNGGTPESANDASTWADIVIEKAKDKGVFSSLVNAGLAHHWGTKRDACVGLTEAGFQAYLQIKKEQ